MGQHRGNQRTADPAWVGALKLGWWDKSRLGPNGVKVMRSDLFATQAEIIAGTFHSLKTNQLRNFYDELKGLDERVRCNLGEESRQAAFWEVLPLVKKVKAMANYACQKSEASVPPEFKRFIEVGVDLVNSRYEELHAFVLLFETVAAYAKTKE